MSAAQEGDRVWCKHAHIARNGEVIHRGSSGKLVKPAVQSMRPRWWDVNWGSGTESAVTLGHEVVTFQTALETGLTKL